MDETKIKDLIEQSCQVILPILRENGIPETPALIMISVLADKGEPITCLNRMEQFLYFLEDHEDKITAEQFRNLTISLMELYPDENDVLVEDSGESHD